MREEELGRVRVVGDDGTWLVAIEFRLLNERPSERGLRRALGRREWRLSTGKVLVVVDKDAFTIGSTGELLRRI